MADSKRWLSRLEPVAQGPGGIGDELGAYWQGEAQLGKGVFDALVNGQPWGDVIPGAIDTYKTARGENRAALAEQQQAEPWASVALEAVPQLPLAGIRAAKAPVATALKDLGAAARMRAPSLLNGVAHAMKTAALPGAIEGYGHSNATDFLGQAWDTAKGAATAVGGAGLLRTGANAAAKIPFVRKALEAMHMRGMQKKFEAADAEDYAEYLRNGKTVEMRHPSDPSVTMRASGPYLDIDEVTKIDWNGTNHQKLIPGATQAEKSLLEALFREKEAAERAAFRAHPERPLTGPVTVPTRRAGSKP